MSSFQKFFYKTITWRFEGIENGRGIDTPVICAFFHGRMFMLPFFYNILRPNKRIKMIVSSHFDGDLIGKVVSYHGIEVIKGSSTRGGIKLLKEVSQIKSFDIGITPDGPKGPGEVVKNGVIFISKITGFPILPVTFSTKKKKILKTWDKFLIPKPFTKGIFICGEPLFVPQNLKNDELDSYSLILEKKLKELNNLADEIAERL